MPAPARARRHTTFHLQIGLILIAAAVVYLVGNQSVPLWDRDEPRYAQTSRQMLQSGDWVVPRYLSDIRTAKPIFIYWCQASAMKVFGDNAFAARFPSVIAMLATMAFVTFAFARWIGPKRAALTALILASSALAIGCAKLCVTDGVLLLWITIAQVCLSQVIYRRATWTTWIAFGCAIGLAGLTKGPVVLGVLGTTILLLIAFRWNDRRLRRRKSKPVPDLERQPICDAATRLSSSKSSGKRFSIAKLLVAIAIVIAICAPWLILIHQRAPEFLPRILGHDVVARVKSGLEGHKFFPGYYLATIWATYFPWSLFLPAAIVYGWQNRRNRLVRFALASVIGPWLMFEIVQTKLVHYMLPVFPWLALLTARAIARESVRYRRKRRANQPRDLIERVFLWTLAGWCAIVIAIGIGLLVFTTTKLTANLVMIFAAIIIALIGAEMARATFVAWRARWPYFAAGAMGVGMLAIIGVFYGTWLPHVWEIRTSQRIAQVLIDEGATTPGSVIMISYKEPSLAFYQGGTIREESDPDALAHTPPLLWPTWVVMTRRTWDEQTLNVQSRWDIIESLTGWWYASGGKQVEVLILRKT